MDINGVQRDEGPNCSFNAASLYTIPAKEYVSYQAKRLVIFPKKKKKERKKDTDINVKCLLNAHSGISAELVGHPGTFRLLLIYRIV